MQVWLVKAAAWSVLCCTCLTYDRQLLVVLCFQQLLERLHDTPGSLDPMTLNRKFKKCWVANRKHITLCAQPCTVVTAAPASHTFVSSCLLSLMSGSDTHSKPPRTPL